MQYQSEEETNAAPQAAKESSASEAKLLRSAAMRSALPDPHQETHHPQRHRHSARSPPGLQQQQDAWPALSAAGRSTPGQPQLVVCAMDNGSTKLRIPLRLVHRTHAVNALLPAADASSPLQRPTMSAPTVPGDTMENSVSVNILPQPIPTGLHDDALLPSCQPALGSGVRLRASTRSADEGEGGNNVSSNMNEGSWQRSPSSGPQQAPSFRQAADGREDDVSWSPLGGVDGSQLQSLVRILREGLELPTPPAICRLFQESRCRQGQRCHQIHIPKPALDTLRSEVRTRGNCCWDHDTAYPGGREDEDPTWRWKLAIIHDALPRLRTLSILISNGTSVGASGEGTTPPTALSLPTLGPNQQSSQGPSMHTDPTRAMERSGPHVAPSNGPESSLELSLTSTPFLSQTGAAPLLPSPKYTSGASHSGEFIGSGDDRSQQASLGEPMSIFPNASDRVQQVMTKSKLRPGQMSPTLGLLSAVLDKLQLCAQNPSQQLPAEGLEIPFSSLCRLHLRGPVCKFGDLCRYIHICRHSHVSMAAIRSPATSAPDRPLPSDGRVAQTTDRIYRTPQGSAQMYSSVVATTGASSGSRTTITTSSGGAESQRKHRSSSSDEEQQLSHVLLPSPTPPPPNMQVKIWQNMPYHFRRKKPSKAGGQKTPPERPEKK
jgi:hypothetical protein